jgi:large subunit ribosomal protein L24
MKFKIKKGDKVVVLSGRDKGKSGEVLRVVRADNRVVVQGVHMVKRHTQARPGQPGGIVEKEGPIHISNVAHIDPKSQQPTRVGYRFLEDGRKVRFAKRSGEILDA